VLVVTDQETVGVGGKSSLAGTRETEEEGNIVLLLADVGRGVKRELAELDGLEVVL
jgi:hypothetical protein